MVGAWITADGTIFNTNNVVNHEVSLSSTGLLSYINNNLIFTDDECHKFLNHDVRYKAFKSGLIRITTFQQQLAIECIIETLTDTVCNAILTFIHTYNLIHKITCVVVEDAKTSCILFFNNIQEFEYQFLDSICNNRH